MTKIKVNTTLRNSDYLDGLARSGDVFDVPQDYAEELVEEKGFASYVEETEKVVTVKGVNYPEGFLSMEIPEGFCNEVVYNSLIDAGFETMGEIVQLDDPTEVQGIGESYASDLGAAILEARDEYVS